MDNDDLLQPNRDHRRVFVRTTAHRISEISSVILDKDSSTSMKQVLEELIGLSKTSSVQFYLPLLDACRNLVMAIEKESLSSRQLLDASEMMKECFVAIQTSLFSFALQGETQKDRSKFNEFILRIETLLKASAHSSHLSRSSLKKQYLPQKNAAHDLQKMTSETRDSSKKGNQALMDSIVETISKLWQTSGQQETALQLFQSSQENYGDLFLRCYLDHFDRISEDATRESKKAKKLFKAS